MCDCEKVGLLGKPDFQIFEIKAAEAFRAVLLAHRHIRNPPEVMNEINSTIQAGRAQLKSTRKKGPSIVDRKFHGQAMGASPSVSRPFVESSG